ncbi:T. brucei spp.-specific protein [Trypanosoma brucei gambiense DAL972]|uniref:T. brucei spp.-specific protein n=1 Tax=Trypanosoma brucei gambiense (strain MHOM/CI/86/DAL972) TaxID=679716 RepID=C9ZTB2_TRYB9|nr:T. brucei spp.-specific protein [Trypanosoma brucei gambiense DAL972]CBH12647.1 T. brucei spp.-specific protein [Trypanosoma brucei gambiense DAL972]|eukprot:XP_011774927.1 T. brucei spp.-specific protein [Trypanosoma brucei gambiense DAL972]
MQASFEAGSGYQCRTGGTLVLTHLTPSVPPTCPFVQLCKHLFPSRFIVVITSVSQYFDLLIFPSLPPPPLLCHSVVPTFERNILREVVYSSSLSKLHVHLWKIILKRRRNAKRREGVKQERVLEVREQKVNRVIYIYIYIYIYLYIYREA